MYDTHAIVRTVGFAAYLKGMETGECSPMKLPSFLFAAYLKGMET